MPRKVTISESTPDEIEKFQLSFEKLEEGISIFCPSPFPQARQPNVNKQTTNKPKKWGSACHKLFKSKHRGVFTSHAMKAHGIPVSATTTGPWMCKFPHPLTTILCGYRFKRLDHLKRHQGADESGRVGKMCAAYEEKANHLLGCDHIFDDGRVCGRSFKQVKLFKRHQSSKDHGGLGARAIASIRKDMAAEARRFAAENKDAAEGEMEGEMEGEEENDDEKEEEKEEEEYDNKKEEEKEEYDDKKEEENVDNPAEMIDDTDQNEACDVNEILSRYHKVIIALYQ